MSGRKFQEIYDSVNLIECWIFRVEPAVIGDEKYQNARCQIIQSRVEPAEKVGEAEHKKWPETWVDVITQLDTKFWEAQADKLWQKKVPRKFECSERWQQSWKSVEILYKNHSKMVKRSLGRTDEQIKPARNVWTSRLETRSTNQVAALTRASEKVKFSSIKYE